MKDHCECMDISDAMEPKFFKALCDSNRIAILIEIATSGKPITVSQISGCWNIDMSVVSRHLAVLRDAGILDAHKQGKEVYYTLRHKELVSTLRSMADAIEGCCIVQDE